MRALLQRIAALLLAATVAAGSIGCVDGTIPLPVADLAGPRLLVIAPHPDDETVGAGGAIATARRRGWSVTIVYVTSGDGFWQAVRKPGGPFPAPSEMQAYGQRRVAEARRASERLGVPASDVVFLGFPDGSESNLWSENWDASNPRRATNGATAVPYPFALRPGAPYSGSTLESQLEQVIRKARPTTVLLPDPADVNRDHWAVAAFSQAALARTGFSGLSLTYLVHRSDFPAPLGLRPTARLAPPKTLDGGPTRWLTLPLDRPEVDAQQAALAEHKTQLRADRRLVESFVRTNALVGIDAPATLRAVASAGAGAGAEVVTKARAGARTAAGAGPAVASLTLPQVGDRIYKKATPSTTVTRVTLHHGDTSSTVSAVLRGRVDPAARYVFRVRSIDPRGAWRFWGGSVMGGKMRPLRDSTLTIAAPGQLVSVAGNTVSVRVPPEALAGAKWAFVGVDVFVGTQYASHTTLQLIRLLP